MKINESLLNKEHGCILCYSGNKHRYLKDLYEILPEDENLSVVDCFTGGGSIATNLPESWEVLAVDFDSRVIGIHKYFQGLTTIEDYTLEEMVDQVKQYCHSFVKDRKDKAGFNALKDRYNSGEYLTATPLDLFALTMSSNNNMIRFSKAKQHYNVPFGERFFNPRSEKKLLNYLHKVKDKNIDFIPMDFRKIEEVLGFQDLHIFDPPYAYSGRSTATYNEQGKWTLDDAIALIEVCDKIDAEGKKFVMFNELVTKGEDNVILQKWSEKYNVKILEDTTSNCSYNRTKTKSVEVMIYNF